VTETAVTRPLPEPVLGRISFLSASLTMLIEQPLEF